MALTSYELSSWHPDPEGHLQPWEPDYDPQIWIRTQHSINMPECVAKLLIEEGSPPESVRRCVGCNLYIRQGLWRTEIINFDTKFNSYLITSDVINVN